NANSTCRDFFAPSTDEKWSVLVDAQEWETYPSDGFCFQTLPHTQLIKSFNCPANVQEVVQVCFRAFDNDGLGCNVRMECMEEICEFYTIPALGEVENHTLAIPNGRSSSGSVSFSIALVGDPVSPDNDQICDAVDFGVLPNGVTLGNADAGNFNNICGTPGGDPDPKLFGSWANDRGVWFKFRTSDTPGTSISIEGRSDPQNTGDEVALQFALYTATDCNSDLEYVSQSFDFRQDDELMQIDCPQPNTDYYLLVDGPEGSDKVEGLFGLAITDNGIAQQIETIDTILCFGESLVVGNNSYNISGSYKDVFPQPGTCDRVVYSNVTVLPALTATANQVEPVSFEGLSDGQAEVLAILQ
ncbi:MAG: hypothetical protein AAFO94_21630, partial [Bacteroidota bacterium]